MDRKARISLVSFPTLPPNEPDRLRKTLNRMANCIDQAAARKSDLVAFPEVCNRLGAAGGWQFEPLDGPTMQAVSSKAQEHGIYVVCPLATLEEKHRYNSSVLVGRDGQIVGVYHKNFPTHAELDMGIVPGTETPVFQTDFGVVGLAVCFDLNYWEVGSGLCANRAELVIWSSMWEGGRMLTRWAMEFGFYIGASCTRQCTMVDLAGREIASAKREISDSAGAAPLLTTTIDMDRRLLHPDNNVARLKKLFTKYGSTAAGAELISHECLLVFGSELASVSSDQLIEEFGLETMRDYLARVRRDRKNALRGRYEPQK
jgi:hypothetical protein